MISTISTEMTMELPVKAYHKIFFYLLFSLEIIKDLVVTNPFLLNAFPH